MIACANNGYGGRRVRARGLQDFRENVSSCRPGALIGRVFKQALWINAALLAFSLLTPSSSHGAATFTIQASNVTWPGQTGSGYYVFDATAYPYTANFSITRFTSGNRNYFVTFSRNSSGNYNRVLKNGSTQISYQIYKDASLATVLKDRPEATSSEVISGTAPNTTPVTIPLTFIVYIPPGQVVGPGTYTDTVTLSVYNGSFTSGQADATVTITISAQIRAVADLALVASGASFAASTSRTLDFGNLAPGQNLGCDLRIRSNIGYTIALASQNRGVLKAPTPITFTIPYAMILRGQTLDLTPAQATFPATSPFITDNNGQTYGVGVTIGTFTDPPAGTYTDVVTVTLTTN